MNIQPVTILSLLLVCISLSGCASVSTYDSTPAHDNMNGTIWMQASTEYAALTTGVYAAAAAVLSEIARSQAGNTGGMAIVLDIDETVLDNSRYQAQLINDNASFGSDSWDRWISLRKAAAVPGVVEFIRSSQLLGFHIVFITNRACRARPKMSEVCPQKLDTLVNLKEVGIDTESTTLFLRKEHPPKRCAATLSQEERADGKWSSDKTSRRECVRLGRNIVMLFGDQLGDFIEVENRPTDGSGRTLAAQFGNNWGKTWFMLPNPTYGDWQPRKSVDKRALIRGID